MSDEKDGENKPIPPKPDPFIVGVVINSRPPKKNEK